MTALALLRTAPRGVWIALAVLLALGGAWRWHHGRVAEARVAGARQQATIDRARFDAAATAATAAQAALVNRLARRQADISKGTEDALQTDAADLARRYDDLRLRWAAHGAGGGGTRPHPATGLPDAAADAAAAACAAAGWVSFDTAATAAQAADLAIAKDDAWIAWAAAQAAAWPE